MFLVCNEKMQYVSNLSSNLVLTVLKDLRFASLGLLAVSQSEFKSSYNQTVIELLLFWCPGTGTALLLGLGLMASSVFVNPASNI